MNKWWLKYILFLKGVGGVKPPDEWRVYWFFLAYDFIRSENWRRGRDLSSSSK